MGTTSHRKTVSIEEHEAALEVTRTTFLKRAQAAEKVNDIYRIANTLRQQLQDVLQPYGITDEQPEESVNDGLRFCYTIGDLAFTHEVFPYHMSLHVKSRPGTAGTLVRTKLNLDLASGLLTAAACAFLMRLQRQSHQPEKAQ